MRTERIIRTHVRMTSGRPRPAARGAPTSRHRCATFLASQPASARTPTRSPPMAITIPAATDQIDYADLYARWERGNWAATEIDFTQDRIDWHERLTPQQRRRGLRV